MTPMPQSAEVHRTSAVDLPLRIHEIQFLHFFLQAARLRVEGEDLSRRPSRTVSVCGGNAYVAGASGGRN